MTPFRIALLLTTLASCAFVPGQAADDVSQPDGGAADATLDTSAITDAALPPDTAPALVTLRETADDLHGAGSDACNGPGAGQSRDETYERVFDLAAFGIAGDFQVTAITFRTNNANPAPGIVVKVGTYTGAVGTTTVDPAATAWLVSASVDVPGSASSQMITAPIAPALAIPSGGVVAVAIVSPGYASAQFTVASAAGNETEPSYFGSSGCGISPPAKTDPRNGSDVGTFVIDVVGYAP